MAWLRIFLIGVFASACGDSEQGRDELQFGPLAAEQEIRGIFEIRGNVVNIVDVRRVAQSKRIFFEPLPVDHSLIQCRIARINDLSFEQYSAGMNRSGDSSLLYIVVFDRRGRVLCIETRHAYRE